MRREEELRVLRVSDSKLWRSDPVSAGVRARVRQYRIYHSAERGWTYWSDSDGQFQWDEKALQIAR